MRIQKALVIIFGAFILLSSYVAYWYGNYSSDQISRDIEQSLIAATKSKSHLIENSIASKIDLLRFLHSTPPISGIVRAIENEGNDPDDNTTLDQWKTRLSVIFKALIENNDELMQLRVLTVEDGKEFLRVDRSGGRVIEIPDAQLQVKKEESYFLDVSQLEFGEVYVSKINLNREHGKVVFPIQPVYRIAMPIFASSGERFGALVMNVSADALMERFVAEIGSVQDFWLVDRQGNFVFSTNSKLNFVEQLNPSWTLFELYDIENFGTEGLASIKEKAPDNVDQPSGQHWLADKEVVYTGTSRDEHLFIYSLINNKVIQDKIADRYDEVATIGGVSIGFLAIITFIFFRLYRASIKLNDANSTFQAMVDGAVDALICVDNLGLVRTWNHAAAQMFGVSLKTVFNKPVTQFVVLHKVDLSKLLKQAKETRALQTFKDTFDDNNGYLKHLDVNLSPVFRHTSRLDTFALRIRDVTTEVRNDELLKQSNAQVRERTEELKKHSEQLEIAHKKAMEASSAKSNFISTISHEMRTPLNGIMGTLSLIQNDPLTSSQKKYLTMAERSVNTLAVLINDILDLSKIESGKLEINKQEFSPRDEVESIVQSMSVKAIEKGLELIIDTTGIQHLKIVSDPNRIKQVINNLLTNAIKFTNSGEIRVVATTHATDNASIRFQIDVFDTGIGIAEENHHKMFQPFSQETSETATKFGGTGLGLSICRQLCQLMDGDIHFESKFGRGSHFYFYLDIPEEDSVLDALPPNLDGLNIGLCCNNVSLTEVLSKQIMQWGGNAIEVRTPIEKWIEKNSLDVIIFEMESCSAKALLKVIESRTKEANSIPRLIEITSSIPLPPYRLFDKQNIIRMSKPILTEDLRSTLAGEFDEEVEDVVERTNSKKTAFADLSGIRILVVDDNEINQEVAKGFLVPLNASVECVSNGQDALDLVLERHAEEALYHCILMDCQMPVMNGYDCARHLRYNSQKFGHSNVPIIAMTANAFSGEKEKCLSHGMSDYITKPVDSIQLIEKVARWTEKHRQRTAPPELIKVDMDSATSETSYKGWKKEQALTRMAGNEALLNKIVEMFQASSVEYMKRLGEEVEAKNIDDVVHWSHKLKGLCGDIGAQDLREILAEMEQESRKQEECNFDSVIERYQQAKKEHFQLMAAIAKSA
ncbi:ATP-binding protein [Vibrio vulnificus]|uniref:ATP-binding protein n=1 Tax=Vibrio vulnificus TaxID=672 RepID=UPI0005FAEF7E|nr:ATP-binding protein [Vibrio vulnificus]EHU9470522.1 response regulator [Vibrio vulnificus]POB93970.1 hybrid sensor histidine kinase/response regulator [Vibrio vulnificus]HDY8036491.1 response regulator [Vibrio vulnificus]